MAATQEMSKDKGLEVHIAVVKILDGDGWRTFIGVSELYRILRSQKIYQSSLTQ